MINECGINRNLSSTLVLLVFCRKVIFCAPLTIIELLHLSFLICSVVLCFEQCDGLSMHVGGAAEPLSEFGTTKFFFLIFHPPVIFL